MIRSIQSWHAIAFDFPFWFCISEMRPQKLELPPSKCDTCAHFLLTSYHITPKGLVVNAQVIWGRSLFVYKQVITGYIYHMKI